MKRSLPVALIVAFLVPLAGCFGGGGFDFEPGTGFKETGKTVHIQMTVKDMVNSSIYPGFNANLWAFCAKPANANDQYSRDAIEYRDPSGDVVVVNPDGTMAPDTAFEGTCSVPGPQLRVQQGDRVIVDFINPHFHPHTIHWHGQFVPWQSDGAPGVTQDSVSPNGGSFRYDFIAKRAGTLWYHCHVDTQVHVMQGLYGVIIVEPQDKEHEPKDIDDEFTLVLGTLRRSLVETNPYQTDPHAEHKAAGGHGCGVSSGFPNCQNPPADVTPDVFMINGLSYPNTMNDPDTLVKLGEGDRIRIRILNAGETVETMHPHGHDMYVTHRDGNPLQAPFWVDTLTIGPAERYDVILEGNNPGVWMFHTHVASHEVNDNQAPGGMHTMIVYEGFEDKMHPFEAELPGGQPFRVPIDLPDDFRDRQLLRLPDQPSGSLGSWQFPVEQACAVKQVRLDGIVLPDNLAASVLYAIDVTVRGPDGSAVETYTLSPTEGDRFTFRLNETAPENLKVADLTNGRFTVDLAGQSVQATMDLSVVVDYYATMEAADKAAMESTSQQDPLRPKCGEVLEDGSVAYGYEP